jgi:hypothetical protein
MSAINRLAVPTTALWLGIFGELGITAEQPSEIRSQLAAVTTEFYALYNRLNSDRQFDMICSRDRAVGTNIEKRVCLPRYAREAQQANATETMQAATHAFSSAYGVATSGEASAKGSSSKWDSYLENLRGVLAKSPELQALAEKRDALRASLTQSKGE